MAGLFPLSRAQQFDANGQLLVGARLFLFEGGTTTPRVGYRDSSLTTQHPNPIVADAAGRLPLIYLDNGFYRQRLTDATGVLVFDDDGIPVLSSTAGGSGTSVDPNATFGTRDIKIRFDDQPVNGYVRLNGRTIGSVASGGTERANLDTQSLYEELWVYPNIALAPGYTKGASGPADFGANKPLVLPNCAGRGLFGMDDMGAGAQGVLTAATIANPTLVGSSGGNQQVTLAQGNLPNFTLTGGASGNFTVSGATDNDNADHIHHIDFNSAGTDGPLNHSHQVSVPGTLIGPAVLVGGGGSFFAPGTSTLTTGLVNPPGGSTTSDLAHVHRITGDTGGRGTQFHKHGFTWTGNATSISINSGGGGVAATNLPPIMTFMIYVRL